MRSPLGRTPGWSPFGPWTALRSDPPMTFGCAMLMGRQSSWPTGWRPATSAFLADSLARRTGCLTRNRPCHTHAMSSSCGHSRLPTTPQSRLPAAFDAGAHASRWTSPMPPRTATRAGVTAGVSRWSSRLPRPHGRAVSRPKEWSRHSDLNRGPAVYETEGRHRPTLDDPPCCGTSARTRPARTGTVAHTRPVSRSAAVRPCSSVLGQGSS